MSERYSRQEKFYGIGEAGQEKLLRSRVTVIGLGALGSASANLLARAGVGHLRIVDRDYVEYSNLQRQMLYTEQDAREAVPKAEAAANALERINSEIEIEPVVCDVSSSNIDGLIGDADLVIDATDNVEIRLLINEACHALKIPWIYGGALASYGMTMNILQGEEDPCLQCAFEELLPGGETCATAGVLGMLTATVSSIQCTEALKILTGSDQVRRSLLAFDMWSNDLDEMKVRKNPSCPVCSGRYRYYGKYTGRQTVSLCGRNAVQIVPAQPRQICFEEFAEKWKDLGEIRQGRFAVDLDLGQTGIKLFGDGRAIIRGVSDEAKARSVYSEYVGLQ